MISKVDELGRIILPKAIRVQLAILEGDGLELRICNDEIVLKKIAPEDEKEQ